MVTSPPWQERDQFPDFCHKARSPKENVEYVNFILRGESSFITLLISLVPFYYYYFLLSFSGNSYS